MRTSMDQLLETIQIHCPYCGVNLEILIDNSAGDQEYIEDCQVCCSPIEISTQFSSVGKLIGVHTKRDSD